MMWSGGRQCDNLHDNSSVHQFRKLPVSGTVRSEADVGIVNVRFCADVLSVGLVLTQIWRRKQMSLAALRVRGPFRGASGYDSHVRSFVKELHRQGVKIQLENLEEWASTVIPSDHRDPLFDSMHEPVESPIVLQFCMPHQMKWHPGSIDVNFTMYESPRIPKQWVVVGRQTALTIVPTESSRKAWVDSGVPRRRVRICPLGIDPDCFHGEQLPLPLVLPNGVPYSNYRFRFLNVSELKLRKNPTGLLRSWLRSTTADDNAALLIKLSGTKSQVEEAEEVFSLVQVAQKKSRTEAAPVHFIYDRFTDEEMGPLYCSASHYISLSHGEGWDLPMSEGIASGLTPIAPDHSAYQSYLNSRNAHLIPASIGPVRAPTGRLGGIPYGCETWWNPDERAAQRIIRGVIDQTLRPLEPATNRIRDSFNWERSTTRLISILEELSHSRLPRRFFLPARFRFRW